MLFFTEVSGELLGFTLICGDLFLMIYRITMVDREKNKQKALKIGVEYYLKASEIFATISVGFGAIAFTLFTTLKTLLFNLTTLLANLSIQQKTMPAVVIDMIESNAKQITDLTQLIYPALILFSFFFTLSLLYWYHSYQLKRKLDNILYS